MAKSRKAFLQFYTAAVGRFTPNGPKGFVAVDVTGAPVRASREEAYQDWLEAYEMED